MNTEKKGFFGKFFKFRFYAVMILFGILFVSFGLVFVNAPIIKNGVVVEATVTKIEYFYRHGEYDGQVYVTFTDENGVEHNDVEIDTFSSSWKEGKKLKIVYDPENIDERVSVPYADKIIYGVIIFGAVIVIIGIVSLVKSANKTSENYEDLNYQPSISAYETSVNTEYGSNGEKNEYYFHYTGKMGQSYVLETPDRTPIYTATCDKFRFFKSSDYSFKDERIGLVQKFKVSHVVTRSYGAEYKNLTTSISTYSNFNINGRSCWDYLTSLGYFVNVELKDMTVTFELMRNGEVVANIVSAGVNTVNDNKQYKLGNIPTKGVYKIYCADDDIVGVFFTCFIASRVDFF